MNFDLRAAGEEEIVAWERNKTLLNQQKNKNEQIKDRQMPPLISHVEKTKYSGRYGAEAREVKETKLQLLTKMRSPTRFLEKVL